MLNKNAIGRLTVVIPARAIVGSKCLFAVNGMDDIKDVEIVTREIQPADEYAEKIVKNFVEVRLYGRWVGNGKDIVDSAESIVVVTDVLNPKDEKHVENLWARVVKAVQVSDYELLVIPRYIERNDGDEIAKCYISDLSIEDVK